eukprot:2368165-Rhodomonas_salina.5
MGLSRYLTAGCARYLTAVLCSTFSRIDRPLNLFCKWLNLAGKDLNLARKNPNLARKNMNLARRLLNLLSRRRAKQLVHDVRPVGARHLMRPYYHM